jgi:uncharacterized protein
VTIFDLRTVKLRPGEEHRVVLPVELGSVDLGGERYVPTPESPDAVLAIDRATSGTVFRLAFSVRLSGPCMRCLGDAIVPVSIDAIEYEAKDADSDELRTPYLADDRLDLSAWAHDAVALSLPEKILCREECAGLCAGCGGNLNEEACRCEPVEPQGPFARLAELREKLGG